MFYTIINGGFNMDYIRKIIDDVDNRGFNHLFGLRYRVCNEIQRLHDINECPEELWVVFDNLQADEGDRASLKSIGDWFGGLVDYLDGHFDLLPSSVQSIIVDYWEHPEKDKDSIED